MGKLLTIYPQTKKVLISILILVCLSFFVAYLYYNSKNKSEDPRVVHTKMQFKEYDKLMKKGNFSAALPILDSIETTLQSTPGYSESYEMGIVYNDKASACLSIAIYSIKDSLEKTNMLKIAQQHIDSSIVIYTKWLNINKNLSKEKLLINITPFFPKEDIAFKGKNYQNILQKRVDDLLLAQKECSRRLSVSYTNLGIIQRHLYKQDKALASYIKAIKLWKDNYTARNNFNVLMGNEPEDRSIIDELFPPEKNKFN